MTDNCEGQISFLGRNFRRKQGKCFNNISHLGAQNLDLAMYTRHYQNNHYVHDIVWVYQLERIRISDQ